MKKKRSPSVVEQGMRSESGTIHLKVGPLSSPCFRWETAMRLNHLFFCLLCCGCAMRSPAPLPQRAAPLEGARWHQVRYYLAWPENQEPDFITSMLLAHSTIQPVLRKYSALIFPWRFHQRAVRDPGGHQLTFYLFVPDAQFAELQKTFQAAPLVAEMETAGVVQSVSYQVADVPKPDEIGGLSDPSWPVELQIAWPQFAQGSSAAWLALVDSLVAKRCPNAQTYPELRPCFVGVFAELETMWHAYGQHAFLHHLSAIFGYRPIQLKKEVTF